MPETTGVATSARLNVRLLGRFAVESPDRGVIELPTQKSKALLSAIVLAGGVGIDRHAVASMLWSRGSDAQARTNLRQSLASIRKAFEPLGDIILSEGSTLRIEDSIVRSDVQAVRSTDKSQVWQYLDELGPLLHNIRIDEPGFADWLTLERTVLQNMLSTLLFDMAEEKLSRGAFDDSRKANAKLLSFDVFDEGAQRQAMRIFAAMGAEAKALRHYEDFANLLKSELGVSPSAATQDLMASLRVPSDGVNGRSAGSDLRMQSIAPKGSGQLSKTSVAVGPFLSLEDSLNEAGLAGLAEDIAIELGRFATLNVRLRQSDDRSAPIDDYILQCSTRLSGDDVRVSVQLVHGQTENLIWAERYDRKIINDFSVQDDITRCVAATVPGRVQADVAERATRQHIETLSAHELMLRGKMLRDTLSPHAMIEARVLLERATALDPANARAQMYLSDTYVIDCWLGTGESDAAPKALHHARLAVAADPADVFVQDHLGFAFLCNSMWRDGQAQIEKTLRKIGNEVESNAWCGYALSLLGLHDRALEEVLKSTERDPLPPATFGWIRGQVLSLNGQYERAIEELLGASILNALAQAFLVGCYARLGRDADAEIALNDFIRMREEELEKRQMPVARQTVSGLAAGFRPMWRREQDWEHIADGLERAGLPR